MSVETDHQEIAEKISLRFRSRWLRGYARAKIARDPVYAAVFDRIRNSPLPLLDIGCGIGILAMYLRERGFDQPILGTDSDGAKIEAAQAASDSCAGLQFRQGDAREAQDGFRGHGYPL